MTKLAPEWVRTSDPVIRSPARYRWTTAPTPGKLMYMTVREYNIQIIDSLSFFPMALAKLPKAFGLT